MCYPRKESLLNCLTYVLTCQLSLRAYVLTCQRILRAHVATCFARLRACVATCFACLRVHVPCVLACLRAFCTYVLCVFTFLRGNALCLPTCYITKISFQWQVLLRLLELFLLSFPDIKLYIKSARQVGMFLETFILKILSAFLHFSYQVEAFSGWYDKLCARKWFSFCLGRTLILIFNWLIDGGR